MEQKAFSIRQAIAWGAQVTYRNFGLFVVIMIIPLFFSSIYIFFKEAPRFFGIVFPSWYYDCVVLLGLLSSLISVFMFLKQLRVGLDIYDTGSSSFKRSKISFMLFANYILASILFVFFLLAFGLVFFGIAFFIGARLVSIPFILIIIFSLLLIVLFFVFLLTYCLYPLALVDTQCGPIMALSKSRMLTCGARLRLLGLYLLSGGIVLVSCLTIIGWLFTIPMFLMARTYAYRKLTEVRSSCK